MPCRPTAVSFISLKVFAEILSPLIRASFISLYSLGSYAILFSDSCLRFATSSPSYFSSDSATFAGSPIILSRIYSYLLSCSRMASISFCFASAMAFYLLSSTFSANRLFSSIYSLYASSLSLSRRAYCFLRSSSSISSIDFDGFRDGNDTDGAMEVASEVPLLLSRSEISWKR